MGNAFPTLDTVTMNMYIDYLTYKIMYTNVPGAQSADEKFIIPSQDQFMLNTLYTNIVNKYRNKTIVEPLSQEAYKWVVSDIYGGITNNNIMDGAGHFGSSLYADDSTYWYNRVDGTPYKGSVCELWADYVAAIMTVKPNTNAVMDEFFPTYDAPGLTKEMLAFLQANW